MPLSYVCYMLGMAPPVHRRVHMAKRQGATQPLNARDRPTILIVDDSADTREMYALYFRTRGFMVLTASNGVEGLEVARQRRPDAIVMDLSMPRLDGITATSQLKR